TPTDFNAASTPLPDSSEISRSAELPPISTALLPSALASVAIGASTFFGVDARRVMRPPWRNAPSPRGGMNAFGAAVRRSCGTSNTPALDQLRRHVADRAGAHRDDHVTVACVFDHRLRQLGHVVDEHRVHMAGDAQGARQRTAV